MRGGIVMTAFEIVKDSIDIVDAAQKYGIEVSRSKKALCPFHDDHNPSLSFKGQYFKCFGCDAGGDVIDLVGMLNNTTPMETVRELNQAYRLNLDLDKPIPSDEIMHRKRIREEKNALVMWEKEAHDILASYFVLLRDWRRSYAPKNPDDELDSRFVEALHNHDYIEEVLCTVFTYGSIVEKLVFFIKSRKLIDHIVQCLNEERATYAVGIRVLDNPSGIVFPFEFAAELKAA
jgi:hypothetical protein